MTAEELVRMDPQDMANQEIAQYRKEREKAAFESVYKASEPEVIFKKTHKGIDHLALPEILPIEPESVPETIRVSMDEKIPDPPVPQPPSGIVPFLFFFFLSLTSSFLLYDGKSEIE